MSDNFDNINSSIPTTNFFLYNDQKNPFNLQLFSVTLEFFRENKENYQENETINLIDDEKVYNLQEKAIKEFIQFCRFQGILQINNDNFLSLNYLAQKYKVHELISLTEKYIENNMDNYLVHLILNSKSYKQKEICENMLAKSLIITTIFRIVTKYQQNFPNQANDEFLLL